ncbi:MAG: restriction endonuclease subunit S [Candidatus Cloacimonetes bacterium]|nr:restriction endonuclease subunit S [Candidatus Cloacimonadota bacterium]MDY0173157.1 restriction endonuclease subunit S [Candidatus Cloacimonadaceae bacterium]
MKTKIKFIAQVINGATPSTSNPEFWDGDIYWATPDDLGSLDDKIIAHTKRMITEEGLTSCGTSLTPEGSIILSTRAPIGHIAITGKQMCCNQGCRILIPRDWIAGDFLYYYLYCNKQLLISYGQGSTFLELSRNMLASISLEIPDTEKQNSIAAFLDHETTRIDALIHKKKQMIELLKEKRTALVTQAVTKGLDPNVKMKDSGIEWLGEVPEHWAVKKLRFLVKAPLQYGAIEAAELDDPYLPRYIRITDIDEKGDLREDGIKTIPWDKAEPYMLNDGDLLLARSGATAGKSLLYKETYGAAAFAGYLIRATFNGQVLPDFASYYTSSQIYSNWLSMVLIQATIQNISAEKYKELSLPVPSICEQRKIVSYLRDETDKIDMMMNIMIHSISLLQEYRSSLIHSAITGKIDLRGYHEEH